MLMWVLLLKTAASDLLFHEPVECPSPVKNPSLHCLYLHNYRDEGGGDWGHQCGATLGSSSLLLELFYAILPAIPPPPPPPSSNPRIIFVPTLV
ncbi:hypothetical protein ACOMHN_045931 [Nucella lapillus]